MDPLEKVSDDEASPLSDWDCESEVGECIPYYDASGIEVHNTFSDEDSFLIEPEDGNFDREQISK